MIAAAGRGERLGRPERKAFVELLGRPLVAYTLDALRACAELDELVLIVAPEDVERARTTLLRPGGRCTEKIVAGGAARQDSVLAGLAEASPASARILVHDGARPFVTPQVVTRTLCAAATYGAALAAVPATDTLKEVDAAHQVTATLDRSRIWQVQTPQAFARELLLEALHSAAAAGVTATDDAGLVERLGHRVQVVLGEVNNFKVTTPEDVARAVAFLQQGTEQMGRNVDTRAGIERDVEVRTGLGYDAHRFAPGRRLVLGGVAFPGEDGLLGHSDADVVCHALCDALLGASAQGDIGLHFPDTDPRFAGVSSLALLSHTARLVRAAGWEPLHLDAVVVAERPKLLPHVPAMRRALAEAMGVPTERVSIKGKTTEGMGFTGRGEGIACHAVATLRSKEVRERPDQAAAAPL